MKRIKYACVIKTIHFMLKEDLGHEAAVNAVKDEVAHYKRQLEKKRTPYKIIAETEQPDGSVMIEVKMQYNDHNVGDYLK